MRVVKVSELWLVMDQRVCLCWVTSRFYDSLNLTITIVTDTYWVVLLFFKCHIKDYNSISMCFKQCAYRTVKQRLKPPPCTHLGCWNMGGLRLTIFVTFTKLTIWPSKPTLTAFFCQRCAGERDKRIWTFHSSHNYFCQFLCVKPSETPHECLRGGIVIKCAPLCPFVFMTAKLQKQETKTKSSSIQIREPRGGFSEQV